METNTSRQLERERDRAREGNRNPQMKIKRKRTHWRIVKRRREQSLPRAAHMGATPVTWCRPKCCGDWRSHAATANQPRTAGTMLTERSGPSARTNDTDLRKRYDQGGKAQRPPAQGEFSRASCSMLCVCALALPAAHRRLDPAPPAGHDPLGGRAPYGRRARAQLAHRPSAARTRPQRRSGSAPLGADTQMSRVGTATRARRMCTYTYTMCLPVYHARRHATSPRYAAPQGRPGARRTAGAPGAGRDARAAPTCGRGRSPNSGRGSAPTRGPRRFAT